MNAGGAGGAGGGDGNAPAGTEYTLQGSYAPGQHGQLLRVPETG
jgi:hypothetical protein